MPNASEIANLTGRATRSNALALASTDRCARAAHAGIAKAYGRRVAVLRQA